MQRQLALHGTIWTTISSGPTPLALALSRRGHQPMHWLFRFITPECMHK